MKKGAFLIGATILVLGGLMYVGWPPPAQAIAAPASWHPAVPMAAEFEGARDGCRKCHLKEYRSWEKTAHATAHETLEGEDATNAECQTCHNTGMGQPGGFVSMDETPKLAGVQCEACHGAGSEYKDRDTMKDQAASIAAGLVLPDENTCKGCHNEQSPTFKGEFDFEKMKAEGVHEIKS
jgi:hypothetical protein